MMVLATFSDAMEAALARNLLLAAGIPAQLDSANGLVGGLGLTPAVDSIRLFVHEEDLVRAAELLETAHGHPDPDADLDSTAFQACDQPAKRREDTPDTSAIQVGRALPYRDELPEEEDAGEPEETDLVMSAEQQVSRAFRAALFGLLFLQGFLHLYSLWILSNLPSKENLSRATRFKLGIAILIDLLVLVPLLFVVLAIVLGWQS
jgi:hypothetical protein